MNLALPSKESTHIHKIPHLSREVFKAQGLWVGACVYRAKGHLVRRHEACITSPSEDHWVTRLPGHGACLLIHFLSCSIHSPWFIRLFLQPYLIACLPGSGCGCVVWSAPPPQVHLQAVAAVPQPLFCLILFPLPASISDWLRFLQECAGLRPCSQPCALL